MDKNIYIKGKVEKQINGQYLLVCDQQENKFWGRSSYIFSDNLLNYQIQLYINDEKTIFKKQHNILIVTGHKTD